MILIVDNRSSYIKELCNAVYDYQIKRYDAIDTLNGYDGIILSGRAKGDKSSNLKNIEIVRYCYKHNIPLLGICYGAEILSLALGGAIRRLERRIQGLYNIILKDNLLIDKGKMLVFGSNGYIISRLPEGFRSIAYSTHNANEIITNGVIFGAQFHPELTDDGRMLISNFLEIVKHKR